MGVLRREMDGGRVSVEGWKRWIRLEKEEDRHKESQGGRQRGSEGKEMEGRET